MHGCACVTPIVIQTLAASQTPGMQSSVNCLDHTDSRAKLVTWHNRMNISPTYASDAYHISKILITETDLWIADQRSCGVAEASEAVNSSTVRYCNLPRA